MRQLTDRSSLESLKKEAKRWLSGLRSAEPAARQRLIQAWPAAPAAPNLRDVQHALALEFGQPNWMALQARLADLELAQRTAAGRAGEFLEHACLNYGMRPGTSKWDPSYPDDPSRRRYAARILERHPEIAAHSIHTAAVCGNLAEVQRILSQRPQAASQKGGPQQWQPLLFLCFGRLPLPAAQENALAIAQALLDHGAAPDSGTSDGENSFTPLTAAIGEGERSFDEVPPHPQAQALVELLLARGAEAHDTQALYNTSLHRDDVHWLNVLFDHDLHLGKTARWNTPTAKAPGTLDYLLGNAAASNHRLRTRWLLEHGANAQAIHVHGGRPLHSVARLNGFTEITSLLERFGAQPSALQGSEAFQDACMRLDLEQARALVSSHPEYLQDAATLMAAASNGRADVVALLLELGMNTELEDRDGARALHRAAWSDALDVMVLLLDRGAQIDARDRQYRGTPLTWAVYSNKPRSIEFLSPRSRDVFGLAYTANLERLRAVLTDEPQLANLNSGGQTPLFSLPDDQDQALAVAQLLLEFGADPQVKSKQFTTAADEAERRGLDAAADVLREKP